MSELISIIIPAYNAEKSIQQTLNSVLAQTHKNIEIIVINDASTDNTLNELQKYAIKDSRIKVINLEENQGVHEARMHGLRASTGQWIGFVDADDYIHPEMYQTMLSDVLNYNADIGMCSVKRVNEQGKLIRYAPKFRKNQVVDSNLLENLTQFKLGAAYLWNRLYSRDVIIDIVDKKFPWRQSLNEDLVINIDCFIKANRIVLNEQAFYSYVDNGASATATVNKEKAYVEHFKAFVLALKFYGHFPNETQELIYDVYRTQFAYPIMHVEKVGKLQKFDKELLVALKVAQDKDPLALVKLASRNSKTCSSFIQRLFRVARKVLSKFVFKDKEFEFIK